MDFKAKYKRSDYINFFRNYLLPEDFDDQSEEVSLGFKPQHISKVTKIGEVPSLELNIYEVTHPAENDPRVSLSRDAFRLLAQYGVKRALIVFNSETSSNFRLSLVTIDLKWEEGKRVQKEYSNPRRYSFFLGPETKTHTPEEYLIKQGRIKDFEDLKNRFSIEVVNKDFYTQIAVLFTQLAGGKRTIGRKSIDAGRGLLNLPSTVDDTLDKEFTVRLLGRLVFCWFLKKKKSNKGISLLPEEILSGKAVSENKGYYHGILEPLFFQVLNTPQDDRDKKYQNPPWSQIPFLNGGLFTPHHHDFYDPGPLGISKYINTLKIPDRWLKELFEVFETYNFTIDENTSVDVELSIEPEMLGRIFENLLAEINPETGETARKATGSYYTPRPIVEYMVDESLKQYLLTKTKLDESQVKSLLTYEDLPIKLSESARESVLSALDAVKVIDPACGSGAFPMGILQKMLLILQKLDPESEWWLERKLSQIESKLFKKELGKKLRLENVNYVHKLGIIQSSIYGVDIQPIAVDISKLRFFLSLIVDEKVNDAKENRGIEPLPNLEFKFVCTNSLIGLPKQGKSSDQLFETEDTQSINELKDLRDEYLRSYGIEKEKIQIKFLKIQKRMVEFYWQRRLKPQTDLCGNKRELKKQEEPEFTRMLSSWDPFSDDPAGWFDMEWMFGLADGFDIVIGNPPYIVSKGGRYTGTAFKKGVIDYFKQRFITAEQQFNTYTLFIELTKSLLSNCGISYLIVPNTFLANEYSFKLREFLIKKCYIHELFNTGLVFEAASVETVVIGFGNIPSKFIKVRHNEKEYSLLDALQITSLTEDKKFLIRINNKTLPLIQKLNKFPKANKFVNVWRGLTTGNDKKFITDSKLSNKHQPLITGADIERYCFLKNTKYVEYVPEKLDRSRDERLFLLDEKLVSKFVGTRLTFTYDSNKYYVLNSGCVTELVNDSVKLKYLLALFNSALLNFYFSNVFSDYRDTFPIMKSGNIENLPVRQIEFQNQGSFVAIVDDILRIKKQSPKADISKLEQKIDLMVYRLYGLTEKEIELVEKLKTEE
jgi:adenine-specific DNA-methyltransferase